MKRSTLALLAIALVAIIAPGAASAGEGWDFAVTPYLWGAGISGTAKVRSFEADVDKSFSDIVKDLELAFMLNLQARRGRFGLYADTTYLALSDTNTATAPSGTALLKASTDLTTWIVDVGASWEAIRWGGAEPGKAGFLDVMLGGRYWHLDTEITAESPFFAGERGVEETTGWFDPIIGLRCVASLTPKLRLLGRADVGGFEIGSGSELTWSAAAYLDWHFNQTVGAVIGWKHLSVEREDDGNNSIDLAFSGPVLGVAFTF